MKPHRLINQAEHGTKIKQSCSILMDQQTSMIRASACHRTAPALGTRSRVQPPRQWNRSPLT